MLQPPTSGNDWVALTDEPLPTDAVLRWSVLPSCGGQVLFTGTVRDHADGREGVTGLAYEAYDEQVVPRLTAVADEARIRWPTIGRVALLHRVGELALGEVSVVVVVSAPHRDEAFQAARFCIDTLKATAPIWKRESWAGGDDWGTRAQPVSDVRGAGS